MTEGQRLLPPGWRWVKLGDVSQGHDAFADGPFGSNLKTAHYSSSGARVIRLQNIGRGVFLDHDKAFVPLDHLAGLLRHSVKAGDIVVAALGDGARPAGRACMIPEGLGPGLVKADCFRIRVPDEVVRPAYLTAYLNSPEVLGRIAVMMRGATRPRVTLNILRTLEMPLPPVAGQDRIVRALEERMAVFERARAAAEAQLAEINAIPAVLLRWAFSGEL